MGTRVFYKTGQGTFLVGRNADWIWKRTSGRMYAECDARRYYWDNAYDPSMFWVDFDQIDIKEGAEPARLNTAGVIDLAGNVSDRFVPTPPYEFLK